MSIEQIAAAKAVADAAAVAAAAKVATDAAAVAAAAEAETAAAAAAAEAEAAALAAKGGKGPTDEEARLLKENMKRKAEQKATAEEMVKLQAQLKAFDGIDPVAVKALLDAQKATETDQLAKAGDWDRLKTRMAEEHVKEIKTVQDQLAALQLVNSAATTTINDLSIGTKFGQSPFIADELTLTPSKARVIYGAYFDLENGEVVGYDKPRGVAGRTAIVDQYGVASNFDIALRKIVEADPEKDDLLKSKIKTGAGSDSKKGAGLPAKVVGEPDGLSKIAAGLKSLKPAS